MKYSIFNSTMQLSCDIIAIYNSMSDKTLFLKGNKENLKEIIGSSNTLHQKLYANGFIVDDDADEVADYIKDAKSIENDQATAHLIINPTINCNFRCWYCYEHHTASQMPDTVIRRIEKLTAKIFLEKRKLQISFFGGEPLIYYKQVILPILQNTQKQADAMGGEYFVNMTTNGFLLNPDRVKELMKYHYNGAQITLDGDKEHHDKIRFLPNGDGSYDRITANIAMLAHNRIPVTVRINCTNENIGSLERITDTFKSLSPEAKRFIDFDFQIVWQEHDKPALSRKMNSIVKSFVGHGLNAAKMSFRDFCYADKRNACVINYNGDIYKCTAVDFHKTVRDGYLSDTGELVWENNSLENRLSSKFKNKPCLECRIFPLCHGGCTKHSMNSQTNYCLYDFDDKQIDQVILDAIEHNIQTQNKNIHEKL